MSLLRRATTFSFGVYKRHISSTTLKYTAATTENVVNSAAKTATEPELESSSSPSAASKRRENLDPALNREKFLVGNPHPVSNLRPVKYPVPENESPEDRAFRERRERVDAFNQNFWVANNNLFNKAKAEYEAKIRAQNGDQPVTTEELSIFYKDFLDKAYDRQMRYNRQWWVENVGLLLPAAKAAIRKWTSR
ncbi:hypothetical protein BGZ80_004421 [Entomortierella chlamydospora]|uniref:Uncharacterized protein n=1 Tax=Entomortierella chlamydospora TaxID=101097 RepID=A0A9P6N0P6_9FUNG|nr:hypothetical protein BGZ79_007204 [Entomortierella chlamydospora]KAG0020296.1 hypothetical protein BGZ80_004421 [Entomortierella chlamydospora]